MPSDLAKSAPLKILVLLLLALQCAASSQAALRTTDRSVQAEPMRSYPVQQTPTQPAVPGEIRHDCSVHVSHVSCPLLGQLIAVSNCHAVCSGEAAGAVGRAQNALSFGAVTCAFAS